MKPGEVTEGKVLHRARLYDLGLKVLSLGREHRMRAHVLDLSRIAAGESVLDVGCGTGTLAIAAAARVGGSGKVHGIDPSPSMVDRAKSKADEARAHAQFQVGTIESIPFPDETFDLVLSTIMLHHLPEAVRCKGFEHVRRVLKPGGRFFSVDFEPPRTLPIVAWLSRMHDDTPGVRAMAESLREAGFTDVKTAPTGYRALWSLSGRR
ncbi:MAG: class I SAM-dependent methyltransferase [Deltaproteobacteria bacterium]|nr:class I SAM-dependent methyltransferase [Deltaproteobacteria bacterium]